MSFQLDSIPSDFWETFDNGHCGIFVGAGLSRAAGFPSWEGLLLEILEYALEKHVVSNASAEEYKIAAKEPDKFLMLATELKEQLGDSFFQDYIENRYYRDCPDPTEFHKTLIEIKQVQFIVTTNYDCLIEKAYTQAARELRKLTFKNANQIQRSLFRREHFYLKAHGDAAMPADGIVLTEHDYRIVLYQELGYRSVLEAMFMMYSMVFIGSSLRDPEINMLLQYINAAFSTGGTGPVHYAVIPKGEFTNLERKRWKRDFGIHFIEFDVQDNYQELLEFLIALKDRESS